MTRALLFLSMILLTACSSTERPDTYPMPSFAHLPFTQFDAVDLEVRNDYVTSSQAPKIDHLAPVSFFGAVETWATHRLRPMGVGRNSLVVSVSEASLTEKTLPVDGGLSGAFKKEQAVEYQATAAVVVQLIMSDGSAGPDVSARVWTTQTAEEGLSEYGRDLVLLDLIRKTVNELDSRIAEGLRESFSAQIVR